MCNPLRSSYLNFASRVVATILLLSHGLGTYPVVISARNQDDITYKEEHHVKVRTPQNEVGLEHALGITFSRAGTYEVTVEFDPKTEKRDKNLRYIQLHSRTAQTSVNCRDEECWSVLIQRFSSQKSEVKKFDLAENTQWLILSWPPSLMQNRDYKVEQVSNGWRFIFPHYDGSKNIITIARLEPKQR